MLLLVQLAHDTVQFFTCLLLSLQFGLLLFPLLLQELLVFGVLHHVVLLRLVVVNCVQSVEQGGHLKQRDKRNVSLEEVVQGALVVEAAHDKPFSLATVSNH